MLHALTAFLCFQRPMAHVAGQAGQAGQVGQAGSRVLQRGIEVKPLSPGSSELVEEPGLEGSQLVPRCAGPFSMLRFEARSPRGRGRLI